MLNFSRIQETTGQTLLNSHQILQSPNAAGMVLLSQKSNNASFGYRVLEGQSQNKGNDTAKSVIVTLTVYDKNNSIVGSQFTYPQVRTFKPDLKSSFKMTYSVDNFKGMRICFIHFAICYYS